MFSFTKNYLTFSSNDCMRHHIPQFYQLFLCWSSSGLIVTVPWFVIKCSLKRALAFGQRVQAQASLAGCLALGVLFNISNLPFLLIQNRHLSLH